MPAIPGASSEQLRRIYTILQNTSLTRIRILPRLSQIIDGDAHLIQTREISAQDLHQRLNLSLPNDEVGRLAATFDRMLARLDDGAEDLLARQASWLR